MWGFSVSKSHDYIEIARKLNLSNHTKWIKLGHYEKTLFGYESNFRGPLFISPNGHNSPQEELEETLKAFFDEGYKPRHNYEHHPQCQFLARRKWLAEQLKFADNELLPCPKREAWKKQLGATKISLIFASADLGNPASSFGHTFIKLINPANAQNKDLIDYGVNYAANANESDFMYAFRGLFGLYGGIYTMLPYHQKIREYINLEGRDIVEYELNLSESEVDEMINHLLELERSEAPYYFFSANCSHQLLTLFEVIKPEYEMSNQFFWWVIPVDTVKAVHNVDGLVTTRKHKKSLYTDYNESYAKLSFLQRKALSETVVKLKIPEDYELSKDEVAEVYETAMQYFAVRGYRTGEDTDSSVYRLSLARAELGKTNYKSPPAKLFAPELSHDSSAVYIGGGSVKDANYSMFKFRSAFHDLEQNDMGVVPMSLNNVGTAELRYYSDSQKWSVHKFTLMHLLNTTPVTQIDKNLSWRAKIEILDQWRPDIEYGAGYSFDLAFGRRSRITSLLSARFLKNGELNELHAGPEVIFISYPKDNLGLSVAAAYLARNENTHYLRFFSKINYEIKRNFDIQFSADDQRDLQASFVYNFIF